MIILQKKNTSNPFQLPVWHNSRTSSYMLQSWLSLKSEQTFIPKLEIGMTSPLTHHALQWHLMLDFLLVLQSFRPGCGGWWGVRSCDIPRSKMRRASSNLPWHWKILPWKYKYSVISYLESKQSIFLASFRRHSSKWSQNLCVPDNAHYNASFKKSALVRVKHDFYCKAEVGSYLNYSNSSLHLKNSSQTIESSHTKEK